MNYKKISTLVLLVSSLFGAQEYDFSKCKAEDYCSTLKEFHYPYDPKYDSILYMTDEVVYYKELKDKNLTTDGLAVELNNKIYDAMKSINTKIKSAVNQVRKKRYKAVGMVVRPLIFGSDELIKYKDREVMSDPTSSTRVQIDSFYKNYEAKEDDFLDDLLRANHSMFLIMPAIDQFDEFVKNLDNDEIREGELQIVIDGFFNKEKGLSSEAISITVVLDKNDRLKMLKSSKEIKEDIRKALNAIVDQALGDASSKTE